VTVQLQNPMQLFNTTSARMNVHDGDVRQWIPGGAFYYYGMCALPRWPVRLLLDPPADC
jgi:hypothetical protein